MLELTIQSWNSFTQFIEKTVENYPDVTANYIQYRGQSDNSWGLLPSLSRILIGSSSSEKKAIYYEREAISEFLSQVHLLDSRILNNYDSNILTNCIDMQHYSCPTRLLDWSESPYVGLYFAVNEIFESDGALFVWDTRFYYRNTKSVYPNIPEVKSTEIYSFKKHDIVESVIATRKNERIARQQGSFSVSNNILKSHDYIIENVAKEANDNSGLYKLQIPKELKVEFLSRLKIMNITAESLFPGLDGLGRKIKETLILRKWAENEAP